MHKGGHIYTLLLGIILSISTLLLFSYNERQREELVSLHHSEFQTIQEAWYLSGSDSKEQYLYPLKQVFYINRYEVKDKEHLQQALQSQKNPVSRPANATTVSDLYIRLYNGKEMAVKVISKDERLFLMDQKTMQYYELKAQDMVDYFHLLNEESRMPFLLFIVYTIIFFSLAFMLAKKLTGAKSIEKETAPPIYLNKAKSKRPLADFIFPAALPFVITFSLQIYGAQHSLLLLSAIMLTSGIREYVEKRGLFLKMVLLLPLFWVYLYGFQMLSTYLN
ncbi:MULTISPECIES: hypothetical protein [unclassified Lysinibacillus]|uniref:hypothetical protein n=1 Tax=unclassified Lysinibacillus TaxID=2636778 RepID=UPI00201B3FBA|nr:MULTISPECIES: hypothetical protein [unclassified Lysinibacillus]